ncbi:MAG TPA: RNA methyltransferase [Planctomycetes bacterium]|nr:RNA methyltransferase [Planctomycetota bacterium]
MARVERITSLQNTYVKRVVAIRRDGLVRQQEGLFFLEGERTLDEALSRRAAPVDVIYVPRMFEEEPPTVEKAAAAGARIVSVSKDVYKKLADTKNPVWMAALFPIPQHTPASLLLSPGGVYVIASNVQDPGNLGTIWRSAACFGASGLVVCAPACDLWNGKVLRASAGAVFAIPAVKARPADAVSAFEKAGVPVYGITVDGERLLTEFPAERPAGMAVGHETRGLDADIERGLAGKFRIPMCGGMDSLNVASAATAALYELARACMMGKKGDGSGGA